MVFLFPSMTMFRTATFSLTHIFIIITQFLKAIIYIIKELFAWFCFLVSISTYTSHYILEHILSPITCLCWWMSLCVCCYKECFKNKATMITLRKSKTEKLVPYDRKLCLFSSYQIEGCFIYLSPLLRIQTSLTTVVSKSKCCLLFLSYKTLYKTESCRIPRKGLIARTL